MTRLQLDLQVINTWRGGLMPVFSFEVREENGRDASRYSQNYFGLLEAKDEARQAAAGISGDIFRLNDSGSVEIMIKDESGLIVSRVWMDFVNRDVKI